VFTQTLADFGWIDGRNVRMDPRFARGDINRIRALAQELVGSQPDVILVDGTTPTAALQRETRTIPIVFVVVADPVGSGFVAKLNQPAGNITGFAYMEASFGGKWLELLLEIAPGLKRVAIMFNPDTAPVSVYMPSFETAARSLKVVPIAAPVHDDIEIETAIIGLGREPGRPCHHSGSVHGRASGADHIGGRPKQHAGGLHHVGFCQRRRFPLMRTRPE
jgi:putative tryptophan/tyrosine transport system substrate-binding protein